MVTCQFLSSLLSYLSEVIKLLSFSYQVKKFILAYGSVPDQGTIHLFFSLYNPPHKGAYILYPDPSSTSEIFKTVMVCVDMDPSISGLTVVAPSGAVTSTRLYIFFSYS